MVATFSIHNTFSILVAQRTRESALLRALGASRRQIVGSVAFEALAVGAVASGVGLAAGAGIAYGLKALMASFGLEMSMAGIVVQADSIIIAATVGHRRHAGGQPGAGIQGITCRSDRRDA